MKNQKKILVKQQILQKMTEPEITCLTITIQQRSAYNNLLLKDIWICQQLKMVPKRDLLQQI